VDSANAPKTKTDTKYNLILSALELFAENGIDAVSMRTINNAAGTRNASAVHYHFGSKIGIIEAIIAFIREELDASRLDALTALERRVRNGERPGCREIMWAAFAPYYRLHNTPEYGKHALRFLARLQIDMSPEVREILNRDTQRIAHRFDALLARALPDLPDNIRRVRYIYFWTLTVQMFAGSGIAAPQPCERETAQLLARQQAVRTQDHHQDQDDAVDDQSLGVLEIEKIMQEVVDLVHREEIRPLDRHELEPFAQRAQEFRQQRQEQRPQQRPPIGRCAADHDEHQDLHRHHDVEGR